MMKPLLLTCGLITMLSISVARAQDDDTEEEGLTTERIRDMKSTYYSGLQLTPFQPGSIDNASSFSFAVNAEVVDAVERFSFRLDYNYFFNVSFEDGIADFNPTLFRIGGSYDVIRQDGIEDQALHIKSSSRTTYFTMVKARNLKSHALNYGFLSMKNQRDIAWFTTVTSENAQGNQETTEGGLANGRYTFTSQLFALGYRYRQAANSVFKTNKYGKRFISAENSIFVNFLFPISITVDNASMIDAAMGSPTTLTAAEREAEIEKWKRLPVGVEFGYFSGSRHSDLVFGVKGALSPGYYNMFEDDIWQLARGSIFLGYRFIHRKEGVVFGAL